MLRHFFISPVKKNEMTNVEIYSVIRASLLVVYCRYLRASALYHQRLREDVMNHQWESSSSIMDRNKHQGAFLLLSVEWGNKGA